MNRLTTKFILFFVIIIFLINFYITNSSKIFINQYAKSFDNSVEQHNLYIAEFLSSFENAIEMFSKNEMVQYVSDHPEKYYESTLELFKAFQESYASTAYAYFAPKKKIGRTNQFVSWPDTSEELSNIGWIAEERPWYINAIKSEGTIAWTEPYIDTTTKKNIITFSKEVRDRENNFKGVMAIDLYLDDVSKKINYFQEFNEGHLLIISRDNSEYFFVIDSHENINLKSLFTNDLKNSLYEKKSGNFYIDNKVGSYYITFTTNMVTGWKIVGVIEQNNLNKGVKDMADTIFFGVIAMAFIGIASILFVTKEMGSTIQILSNSIDPPEEKVLSSDKNTKLFEFKKEESVFEMENANMNILFEIEAQKEKINEMVKNRQNLDSLNIYQLKISIKRLLEYLNHLDLTLKSHEIQKESVINLFIEIQAILGIMKTQSITYEEDNGFRELDALICGIMDLKNPL
ncbi:Cache domain-containing protein [Anaerovirgula multivorans]|uniref:Cache domain-containing protein n=1 Tax=Anaerovirgula multivorans TaxID=312168 RepID=A0A239HKI9_9FIRM|nr:cache domain-containing protein [Anaerovirgula multivorans]SNS81909.1 Cache domain-containing protein [Anaerovirgula multivorans]